MCGRMVCAVTTSAVLLFTASASAQSTAQLPLQFDFLPPGARSVGMGSAFIAAADDATAAFTNPAGLARLGRREISAELRFKRLETPFLLRRPNQRHRDQRWTRHHPDPCVREDIDDQFGPAFLLVSLADRRQGELIGYRHEAVDDREHVLQSRRL